MSCRSRPLHCRTSRPARSTAPCRSTRRPPPSDPPSSRIVLQPRPLLHGGGLLGQFRRRIGRALLINCGVTPGHINQQDKTTDREPSHSDPSVSAIPSVSCHLSGKEIQPCAKPPLPRSPP